MTLIRESDPNGIRTRVTAVKGRCPRPLDDRVTKSGNIGIAIVRRKANWQPNLDLGDMSPQSKRRLTFNVSVRAREPAWLSARFRLCARLTLHAHFPRDAGAIRYRGEARQVYARASRRR